MKYATHTTKLPAVLFFSLTVSAAYTTMVAQRAGANRPDIALNTINIAKFTAKAQAHPTAMVRSKPAIIATFLPNLKLE